MSGLYEEALSQQANRSVFSMNVLGIELNANKLNYVLLECDVGEWKISQSNQLTLDDTRSRQSLRAFHDAVRSMLNATMPSIVGIKSKPESGQMRAGAASLKMEGILLASAPCDVDFVSGQRINACPDGDDLRAYQQPAFKTALAALRKQQNA